MRLVSTPIPLSERMACLFERLRHDADHVFGTRRVQVVPLTISVRESSEVARAQVITALKCRYIFAKIFTPRPGEKGLTEARTRFRADCEVTRHVFEAMKWTADLCSVEPIACYDDLLGIVTKEISGFPLSVLIAKNARWPGAATRLRELEVALGRIGRWLAAFQRIASGADPSRMSLDATREYIDDRLKKLTLVPRAGFDEVDRRDVLAYFDRRAAEVPSADLVDVPVHGDIVPSNVVVATDRVTVLDFGMTARGSKYLDAARLYSQLQFYTAKPQYRPQVIARLQQAALTAFEPGLRADNPLFEICAVQHVVCHLLSHARQPGPFPASVYSGHQRRRHRRWLRERSRQAALRDAAPQSTVDSVL